MSQGLSEARPLWQKWRLNPGCPEIGSVLGNLILKLSVASGPHTSLPIWGTAKSLPLLVGNPHCGERVSHNLSQLHLQINPPKAGGGERLWLQQEG